VAGLLVILPAVLTIILLGWIANLLYGFLGPGSIVGRGLVGIGLGFVSSQWAAYLIGIAIALRRSISWVSLSKPACGNGWAACSTCSCAAFR
jgi:uncharacterized membrane protein